MSNEQSQWQKIIAAVKSFYGLCALELLVVLSAFGVTAAGKASPTTFYSLLVFAVFVACLAFYFDTASAKSELTFRIRVNRFTDGAQLPLDGVQVQLFKNGKVMRTRITDEQGEVDFSEAVSRSDELYVKVTDGTGTDKKAALYSDGQCRFVKTILIA